MNPISSAMTRSTNYLALVIALVMASSLLPRLNTGVYGQYVPSPERIRPYSENSRYWQYKGQPLLLLGGSKDDSLFQIPDLREHLEKLAAVGGNYVRNTMSDRQDHGFEVYPYKRLDSGKFDLDQWNEEYWARFERFLKWTEELEIIVQIEVWDRFDHSQQQWEANPYRPINNVNYTTESSSLRNDYPAPAWRDRQPFFHSIPGMPRYNERLDLVRRYQERFVLKMLSYSLPRGHVLYCMNNETSTPPRWGRHWIALIQSEAAKHEVDVFCTDMFNDAYAPARSKLFAQAWDDSEVYGFLDISQVNSRLFDEDQWHRLRWIMQRTKAHSRPINCVKIYGSGETKWGSGTPKDGVERFWRDLFAGCAAVRHHRDGGGIGLQPLSQACIRAARKMESAVKLWDVVLHQELLSDREPDEAYLLAQPGQQYLIFFPQGGSIRLDLTPQQGKYRLTWLNVSTAETSIGRSLEGGQMVEVKAPQAKPCVAILVR
jgi:hypothetical protein